MPTLLLDRNAVSELLHMPEVIGAVEQAFKDWQAGKGDMPPKAYLRVERGDFRAMPAALPLSAGMKWVNAHPGNTSTNLPSVMAVIVLNDPDSGYPLAIMEGARITAYRTGATAAIASRYLAPPGSTTLGIIGAGYQAYTQIIAHTCIFDLAAIHVFDTSPSAVEHLIARMPGYPIRSCTAQEAAAADILCTLTPSRGPVVEREWIKNGTHINAVGADAAGKQELDPAILKDAKVVVDDIRQAGASGEINVPISTGRYSLEEVYAGLGEIICGNIPGRMETDGITVFDSTGVAIEDMAVAKLIYNKARLCGGYPLVDMVEERR